MVRIILITLLAAGVYSASAVQITYTENTNSADQLALGYPVPLPVDSLTPIAGFRNYDSLMARHQSLMMDSPLIDGSIIGQTIEGENIWAYVLSDSDEFTIESVVPEPSMLQNGGIHSREWQSPEVLTGIMERFFEQQNDNGFYQYMLENNKIVLIPSLNISGFRQTQRFPINAIRSTDEDDTRNTPRDGRMRRKNMRNVDMDLSTEADFLNGTDLNRNNDPFWASSAPQRSSTRSISIVHHGSGPASEPETQALQAAAILAGEDRLRFYIDTHSFTKIYFTPLTGNGRRDNITSNVAARMRAVNNNRYAYGPSNPGGGIGTTDEYFAYTYQIPSYTLETEPGQGGGTDYGGFGVSHDGFILPNSEISRVTSELTNASILGYYLQAGPPSVSQIVISNADNGDIVFAGQWVADNSNRRLWQETVNSTLQTGQTYNFWIAFNKPMRWRINNAISNYPGQNVDINPQINIEGFSSSGSAYSETLVTTQGAWLNQPGGSPNGYENYADDAFSFTFQLDDNSSAINATLVQLSIETEDLGQQDIDASPSTVVDWRNGAWTNYESSDGRAQDVGGTDRTVRMIDDNSPGFTDPQDPPPPTPPSNNSSGGGSLSWLLLFVFVSCRRKREN